MVDYYALISPTIEPLADASPDERQVVYRRLVDMLDQQLRAADPPRSDKDILREKIELQSAIRRVERHVLARQKTKTQTGETETVSEAAKIRETPKPVTIETSDAPLARHEIPIQIPIRKDILGLSRFSTPTGEYAQETLPESVRTEPSPSFKDEPHIHEPEAEPSPASQDDALPEEPSASETHDTISLPPASAFEDVPIAPLAPREFFARPLPAEAAHEGDELTNEAIDEAPSLPHTLDTPFAPVDETQHPRAEDQEDQDLREDRASETDIAPIPVPEPRAFTPTTEIILAQQKTDSYRYKGLILRLLILFLVLLALMAAVAGVAAFLNRNAESDISPKTTDQNAAALSSPTKFTDRLPVEPDEPQASAPSQTATTDNDAANASANSLVTRALLIEEQAGGIGDAKKTEGRVSWKLDTLTSGTSGAADLGVRATVDLSDAGLTASLLFRKNRDLSSANAYLIEVNFQPVGDTPNGKIRDITVLELRPDEKTRGVALAGIPVPVSDNVFLIGLNALPADMKRNIELIQKQNWFFIQLRFATGKRALLLFEKGKTGDRVFEDAIQAWK